jgi:hypothetical protein
MPGDGSARRVGGSNPLSPTNLFTFIYVRQEDAFQTPLSVVFERPFFRLASVYNQQLKYRNGGSRIRMLGYPAGGLKANIFATSQPRDNFGGMGVALAPFDRIDTFGPVLPAGIVQTSAAVC